VRLELPQAAKWEAQIKAAKDQAARANVPKF
jgi:outer membrane murein-binding lipoprotein Lpp